MTLKHQRQSMTSHLRTARNDDMEQWDGYAVKGVLGYE